MSAQHTPGPWSQYEHDPLAIVNAEGSSVGEMVPGDPTIGRATALANARLAAAAPELLEAAVQFVAAEDELIANLKELGEEPALYGIPFPKVDAMRAAIAKATGAA